MNSGGNKTTPLSREEFEEFLHEFTHEIRNRLNSLSLEAADLAEQVGEQADASRLQQQIRDCSVFLKKVRDQLAPDEVEAKRKALAGFFKDLRERME